MNYLVRGLVSASDPRTRFVLTLPGDDEHWDNLGIVPVHFPESSPPESKFVELGHAIASWVEISHLGALDIEQRIKEIVEGPVPLDTERLDYIRRAVGEITTLRFVVRHATRLDWMQWMDDQSPEFARLFQADPKVTNSDSTLANWFAENFAFRHSAETLTLLQKRGFSMHPLLWTAIAHQMHRQKPESAVLSMWLPILIQNRPQSGHRDFLDYVLSDCKFPDDKDVALLLFSALTAPEISLDAGYIASTDAQRLRADVATAGSYFWLNSVWTNFFRPNIAAFALHLFGMLTTHLASARILLKCYAPGAAWDALSFRRGMIESRTQDHLNNGISVVLDAAADLVRWSATEMPSLTVSMSDAWIGQDSPLLRRLAIYAVFVNRTWTADSKISWLLDHTLLYAPEIKHELFLLLEAAYPDAGPDLRRQVVERTVQPDHAMGDYEQFNLLTWLAEKNPTCEFAARELAKIREQHQDYDTRKHPDMGHWMEEATWDDSESHEDHLDLKGWSLNKIVGALERARSAVYPGASQVETSLRRALAESFPWGVELAAEACAADVQSEELWSALLSEWEALGVEDERWSEMLKLLLNCEPAKTTKFAQLSSSLDRKIRGSGGIPLILLPDALSLVHDLWTKSIAAKHESPVDDTGDWLTVAINSTGGNLMSFYLHALSHLSPADADRKHIPDSYKTSSRCR